MHLGIKNFVGGARKHLFGDGGNSGNIIQGGSALQVQASYEIADTTDLRSTATYSYTGAWNATYTAAMANDGNTSTMGQAESSGGQTAVWCFPSAVNIRQIGIHTVAPGGMGGTAVALEYSDNGTTWNPTNQSNMSWTSPTSVQTKSVNDYGAHRWWRLRNTGANHMQFAEIAWYQRIAVTNAIVVTTAATVAPDGTTGASVVQCDTLVVDGGTLAPSTNSKGLIVLAKSGIRIVNGGKAHIDKLGKAGNLGNLTVLDLVPQSIKRKLKPSLASCVVLGEGAAGAAGSGGYLDGKTGSAAGAMQTGGGGSGGLNGYNPSSSGAGGKGGPCCGGSGSPGIVSNNTTPYTAPAANPYGGPGLNASSDTATCAAGGGTGDTPGTGANGGLTPTGAGGGLLMLFTPLLSVASGCVISADGAAGVTGSNSYQTGSGGAGGGCVVIGTLAGGYSNSGTVRASGGAGTAGATHKNGGAGGAGSVNTFTLS